MVARVQRVLVEHVVEQRVDGQVTRQRNPAAPVAPHRQSQKRLRVKIVRKLVKQFLQSRHVCLAGFLVLLLIAVKELVPQLDVKLLVP